MAWCHQATSHYLSQCWPRSLSPYDVTRPQWVKSTWGNGLLPKATKTLPEPILTHHQRCSVAFMENNFMNPLFCVQRLHFENYDHISQGQCVKWSPDSKHAFIHMQQYPRQKSMSITGCNTAPCGISKLSTCITSFITPASPAWLNHLITHMMALGPEAGI